MAEVLGADGEVLVPFCLPSWQADLAALQQHAREEATRFAQEARLLRRLVAEVPRSPGDERGATAWTSFLREVAVARRWSDRVTASAVAVAVQLGALPCTEELLALGELPVPQARALVEQTWTCDADTLEAVDLEVAERACRLSVGRVRQAVDEVVLRLDADAVAARAARKTADRQARLVPLRDDQADLALSGPALPLVQAWSALDADARTLRAAGDGRTLDALRFDLAVERLLGDHCTPLPAPLPDRPHAAGPPALDRATWTDDRRFSRPVRLDIAVPLGLSHEPGWVPGYGWISAPTVRQLLVTAELRRLCVDAETGVALAVEPQPVRPGRTPAEVAAALRDMATRPHELDDVGWRVEDAHDPSDALRELVLLRDRACDGPTQVRVPAARADVDHDVPWGSGPTAAWNLRLRSRRTHLQKHAGWIPMRTPTSTVWRSPAGQVVEVPRHVSPPEPLHPSARLPDPDALHAVEAELLRPPTPDDQPPVAGPPVAGPPVAGPPVGGPPVGGPSMAGPVPAPDDEPPF